MTRRPEASDFYRPAMVERAERVAWHESMCACPEPRRLCEPHGWDGIDRVRQAGICAPHGHLEDEQVVAEAAALGRLARR